MTRAILLFLLVPSVAFADDPRTRHVPRGLGLRAGLTWNTPGELANDSLGVSLGGEYLFIPWTTPAYRLGIGLDLMWTGYNSDPLIEDIEYQLTGTIIGQARLGHDRSIVLNAGIGGFREVGKDPDLDDYDYSALQLTASASYWSRNRVYGEIRLTWLPATNNSTSQATVSVGIRL